MTYCALLIPQEVNQKKDSNQSFFEDISGKLMSGVNDGGFNIDNVTTVMKNTARLLSDNMDTITAKFSGIALAQLLADGKMTNQTALGYLTQGMPKAMDMTAVAQGFQSLDAFKTALSNGNVNVAGVVNSLSSFGGALSDATGFSNNKRSVEGYETVELDVVTNDTRNYQSETPDRRVQSGQTYQEYVHNIPNTVVLQCYLQDGRNYSGADFESLLTNLRERKLAINIILGDETKENYVLTNFSPTRSAIGGYEYSLEFKKIQVGSIQLVPLKIRVASSASVIKNELYKDDTKTEEEKSNGYGKALDETKSAIGGVLSGIWNGIKMGFGG